MATPHIHLLFDTYTHCLTRGLNVNHLRKRGFEYASLDCGRRNSARLLYFFPERKSLIFSWESFIWVLIHYHDFFSRKILYTFIYIYLKIPSASVKTGALMAKQAIKSPCFPRFWIIYNIIYYYTFFSYDKKAFPPTLHITLQKDAPAPCYISFQNKK